MPSIDMAPISQQPNLNTTGGTSFWQSLVSPICKADTDCVPIDRNFLYNWAIVQAILIFVWLHVRAFLQNREFHQKLNPPLVNENDMLEQVRILRWPHADFDEKERVRSNLIRGMVRTQRALYFYSYMANIHWKRIQLDAVRTSVEGMYDWIREGEDEVYESEVDAYYKEQEKERGDWQLNDGPVHTRRVLDYQERDLKRNPKPGYY